MDYFLDVRFKKRQSCATFYLVGEPSVIQDDVKELLADEYRIASGNLGFQFSPALLEILLELVSTVLAGCLNKTPAQIKRSAVRRGPLVKLAVRNALKQLGHHKREDREELTLAVLNAGVEAPVEKIKEFMKTL